MTHSGSYVHEYGALRALGGFECSLFLMNDPDCWTCPGQPRPIPATDGSHVSKVAAVAATATQSRWPLQRVSPVFFMLRDVRNIFQEEYVPNNIEITNRESENISTIIHKHCVK